MKILFLQNCSDVYGGLEFVNQTLADEFVKDKYDVEIISLWYTGNNQFLDYDEKVKKTVISNNANYKKPSKRLFLDIKFGPLRYIIKYAQYVFNEKLAYIKFRKYVNKLDTDHIIVSNPLLIKTINRNNLKKVICHMHSGIKYYKINKKITKILQKYNNKINCFLWLTKATSNEAKKIGFLNSKYIYNPIKFKSKKISNTEKKAVFVGRLSPEKRVDLVVEIFNKANTDWTLDIYGEGEIPEKTKKIIDANKNINYLGLAKDVKKVFLNSTINLITSDYEGFSLTLVEGYECGVPAIAFDFGSNTKEMILDGKTGFIIKKGDTNAYIKTLENVVKNPMLLEELKINSKQFSKKLYIEVIKEKWYDLFRGEL